jgi:hypothetical protein
MEAAMNFLIALSLFIAPALMCAVILGGFALARLRAEIGAAGVYSKPRPAPKAARSAQLAA